MVVRSIKLLGYQVIERKQNLENFIASKSEYLGRHIPFLPCSAVLMIRKAYTVISFILEIFDFGMPWTSFATSFGSLTDKTNSKNINNLYISLKLWNFLIFLLVELSNWLSKHLYASRFKY